MTVHVPLQSTVPLPQLEAQEPETQYGVGDEQVVPHAPQLLVLFVGSTQTPPQLIWPVGQHLPRLQLLPDAHAVPQAPQWAAFVAVSTHVVPQRVNPVRH